MPALPSHNDLGSTVLFQIMVLQNDKIPQSLVCTTNARSHALACTRQRVNSLANRCAYVSQLHVDPETVHIFCG